METNAFFNRFNELWEGNKCGVFGKNIISDYDFKNMEVLFWNSSFFTEDEKNIIVTMLTKKHILDMKLSSQETTIERYRRVDITDFEKKFMRDKNPIGDLKNYCLSCVNINFSNGKLITIPYPRNAYPTEQKEFEKFIEILETSM